MVGLAAQPAAAVWQGNQAGARESWRTRHDSNLWPLPSEGSVVGLLLFAGVCVMSTVAHKALCFWVATIAYECYRLRESVC
jgi:hypothetical protein